MNDVFNHMFSFGQVTFSLENLQTPLFKQHFHDLVQQIRRQKTVKKHERVPWMGKKGFFFFFLGKVQVAPQS
jgi:hypothetical protein